MSIALMTKAWHVQLAVAQKMALLALCDWANDDGGSVHPSIKALAERVSCSERQAQRIVHRLIEDGWVSVIGNAHGGAPGQSRRYRVNADRLYAIEAPKRESKPAIPTETGDTHVTGDKLSRVTSETETGDICDTRRVTSATETGDMGVTLSPIEPSIEPSMNHQRARRARTAALELPVWLAPDVWAMWDRFRSRAGKGWTDEAKRLSLRTLTQLHAAGHDPRIVVEQSVERGWRGLFAPKAASPPRQASTIDRLGRQQATIAALTGRSAHSEIIDAT